MPITDPVAALRGAALRVTRQRVAVLTALADHPHADAEHLGRTIRATLGSISTQAVYDALDALTQAGLVRRLAVGSRGRFEVRDEREHDHLVCRSCGTLTDIDRADEPRPPRATHGYRVDQADTTYWGRCPDCL